MSFRNDGNALFIWSLRFLKTVISLNALVIAGIKNLMFMCNGVFDLNVRWENGFRVDSVICFFNTLYGSKLLIVL